MNESYSDLGNTSEKVLMLIKLMINLYSEKYGVSSDWFAHGATWFKVKIEASLFKNIQ